MNPGGNLGGDSPARRGLPTCACKTETTSGALMCNCYKMNTANGQWYLSGSTSGGCAQFNLPAGHTAPPCLIQNFEL